jgi:hypothetical protein
MAEKHPFHDALMPAIADWLPDFLEWERVHPTLQGLERERDDTLAKNDPERRLTDLCRRIALLKAEVAPLQPAGRYLWLEGAVLADSWYEFASHWRRLQVAAGFDKTVGPDGGKLREADRWAWEQLFGAQKGTK